MIRIPSRLSILGRQWTVSRPKTLALDGEVLDALCERDEFRISVCADLKGEFALRRFVHEALHAEFPEDVVSDRVEEVIVNALALPVLDIVRAMSGKGT